MASEIAAEVQPSGPNGLPSGVSYKEFLAWMEEDRHLEWVDGRVIRLSPISLLHQRISLFLLSLIEHFVEGDQLGIVCYEPFQMKTGPDLPGRSPDIMFIAAEHAGRLKPHHLEGPADLVVEVISPESRGRDRGEKYYEYEQGGVQEYWLIDPERKRAEFYALDSEGIYALMHPGEDGVYRSSALQGLWLRVEWLWQDPLPPLLSVLREWNVI